MLDNSLTVGEKLKVLRDHFSLSQRQFAALLGVSGGTIASYEARPEIKPREDKLRSWADRFGFPYAWFLDGQPGPPAISRDYKEAEIAAKRELEYQLSDQFQKDLRDKSLSRMVEQSQSYEEESNIQPIRPDDLTYDEEDFALGGQMVDIPVWQGVMANLDETHFIEEKKPRTMKVPPFFFSRKKLDRFIVALPKGRSMAPRIVNPDRIITLLTPDAPPNAIVVARRSDNVNFVKVLRVARNGKQELHSINEAEFPPIVDLYGWTMRGAVVGIWKPYEQNGPNIEFNGGLPLRA